MSAYKEIKTEFKSRASLIQALKDCGLDNMDLAANPTANTLQLAGYGGRAGAMVAIRLPKSHYKGYEDVGFAWDGAAGCYKAIISTHDGSYYGTRNIGAQTLQAIQQRYAYNEVKRMAVSKGYTVRETAGTDGVIRLQLTHR